ncbi:DUF4270 family protein [Ferruginibacter profundus]
MQKRILSIATTACLFLVFINWSCSKLDTTDIGSDLLPAVDNVNTFDTLLTINTTQGIFDQDSTIVNYSDDHVVGKIPNDPLFGATTANIYTQFKPGFYPFYYGNAKDTIVGFDSVVLCLSYKGFWGDSTVPIQLQVNAIQNIFHNNGLWDSINQSRNINYAPNVAGVLGNATIDVRTLGNYVKYANGKDSVKDQIRIKFTPSVAAQFFALDTNVLTNNYFRSDSLFRLFNNGFAVSVNGSGNGLIYTNFTDSSSKLEVHFRRKNGGAVDTTYTALKLISSGDTRSVTANNLIRNRSGHPVLTPAPNEIYLQTGPGTYANLDIPDLGTISNRIIHRAEIIVEQIPDPSSAIYTPTNFLYVDLKDTGTTKWKPIYFDLNPNVGYDPDFKLNTFFPSAGVDFLYHGGYAKNKTDQFGNTIKAYNFNITRYVQQIVTKHTTNYQLRLYAPYMAEYPQYASPFDDARRSGSNRLAFGRVKVGGGNNANYKMRLRLVYSKI